MARQAELARDVAARSFDLDHVRAHAAQDLRGEGAEQDRGQIDNTDAIERTGHRAILTR